MTSWLWLTLSTASALRATLRPPPTPRSPPPRLWTGETAASIEIRAPPQTLFDAYSDIERMPQWSPLLASVVLTDPAERLSEWSLRVPRPLAAAVSAAGMGEVVRWQAVHEVDIAPGGEQRLSWRSLSGVQNAGVATFAGAPGGGGPTTLTLRMEYTLPDVARPLLESELVQRFVRRTLLSTMERFRDTLEDTEDAARVEPAAAASRS